MSDQYSPWASGEGFGTPRQPPRQEPSSHSSPAEAPTATGQPNLGPAPQQPPNYTNPTQYADRPDEPGGWSVPQQFDLPPQQYGALQPAQPAPIAQFGQRTPYGYGHPPEHPQATTVMTLGIVGLVTIFFCFPVISPVAWYLGNKARREMSANPGAWSDSGKLTAGITMGVIGTVLASLGIVVMVIAVIGAALYG